MRKDTAIIVRVSREDLAQYKAAASARGEDLSALVRGYLDRITKRAAKAVK